MSCSAARLRRSVARSIACAAALCAGCARTTSLAPVVVVPDVASWRTARQRLADLSGPRAPRTLRVAVAMTEPRTGRTLQARGAVAVAPPDSLRMILLGPGGATALDMWVAGDRYRFAVPPIDLLRRGTIGPGAATRGLPVGFLRWWLLRPLGGRMLWYDHSVDKERFVLRDGAACVDVVIAKNGSVRARRAAGPDVETIEADRLGCGRAVYTHEQSGLSIAVQCEGIERSAPRRDAFQDPDSVAQEG